MALLFAPLAQQKGLDLFVGSAPGLKACYISDTARIRQILNNLVSNAIKFTESGKISLRVISVVDAPDNRDWLRFEVTDSGMGIAAPDLARLFEPFTQARAQRFIRPKPPVRRP